MIEELKPYSSHRATGVYWLPRVPEHWEIVRSKHVFAERTELARAGDVQLSATQAYGVIPQAEFERRVGRRVVRISMHLDKRSHVEQGDFVISMRSFQGGLERAWASGAIRSSYVVLRPARELDLGYFTHLFKAQPYIKALQATGNFIRDGQDLTFGNFTRVDLPVPPRDEQMAIGRFLDHASRRIDQFIRAKKKLIALLNEQKQAIVHRAVTRGLDPDVKLKDSGVPWLGAIPDHWDVRRFKMIATINSGQVDPRKSQHRSMVLVAPNHIEKATGRLLKTETAQEQGAISGKYLVRKGQVIYSKIRPALQKATLAPFDCLCSADMYAIDARSSIITPAFLLLLLLSRPFSQYTVDASLRVAMPKVNQDALAVCPLWLPPRQEQDAIVALVQESSAPLDRAIARAEREIALMREYRTRLVADVVTGELDARAAAASLPAVELGIALTESEGDETDIEDGEAA